jgi:hypothetical protein
VLLAAGLAGPASRQRLIARARCVITARRVRTGCRHAGVQARDGAPPIILYTMQAAFGERIALYCGDGITHSDLEGARDILRAACRARDVRVVADRRSEHVVVLEVIRRLPAGPGAEAISAWPYMSGGADPGKPALSVGRGTTGRSDK